MIYSMTGFGRSNAEVAGVDIAIELQSVNRRALELGGTLPREWQELEREIQALLRERLERGKVNYSIKAQPANSAPGFHWDDKGLDSTIERLATVAAKHGIKWPPEAATLVQLASLNRIEVSLPEPAVVQDSLIVALRAALEQLLEMRGTEGSALAADLSARVQRMREFLESIVADSRSTVPAYRELLMQRLQRAGVELDLSDERVLKEIALFADKCDISEETIRLGSHFAQFDDCLRSGSPVGRKLEFIVQEINREFNTIGSKSHQTSISQAVIEAKNELERVREQIQNIE